MYSRLYNMKSEISIYRNDRLLWSGRIVSTKRDIYRCKTFVCEGELGYLNDSSRAPMKFEGTVEQYLQRLLDNHNQQVYTDAAKIFQLGSVTVSGTVSINQQEPEVTWNLIDSNLLNVFGGYLVIRHEANAKYIDYLAEYGKECNQRIELGVNLTDIQESVDASNIYTVLVPLGKNSDGDYVGIESVNNDVYYIQNTAAVDYYGRIVKTIVYDDLDKPEDILAAAQADIQKTLSIATTITVDGVDLTLTGIDTDSFDIGSNIPVYAEPHGINFHFICNEISENIGEPGSTKYTLGVSVVSLTAKQIAAGQRIAAARNAAIAAEDSAAKVQQSVNALADTVGTLPKTLSGNILVIIPENGEKSVTVTFPSEFNGIPEVLISPRKSGKEYKITEITTQGFTFTALGSIRDQIIYSWIATK